MSPELTLPVDPAWAAGLLLAMIRVSAFVVVCPIIGKGLASPARIAFALAIGWFLATPVDMELTVGTLVVTGVANAVVGSILGMLAAMLLELFAVAGNLIDISSGTNIAAVFDPTRGEQGAVFGRLFHLIGTAVFVGLGGIGLLAGALVQSARLIPLTGGLSLDTGLAAVATDLVGQLVLGGLHLAIPVLSVLFVLELALALGSRFVPQANVFLLGLPAKVFLAMSVSSTAMLLLPDAARNLSTNVAETLSTVMRGLAA